MHEYSSTHEREEFPVVKFVLAFFAVVFLALPWIGKVVHFTAKLYEIYFRWVLEL